MTIYRPEPVEATPSAGSATPSSPPDHGRIAGLDFARGLAILGMVVVHFLLVLHPSDGTTFPVLDLLDGRPTTVFMLLAGMGITLMARRRDPGVDLGPLTVRRGLLLLAVGFANLILWPGDILRIYGVIFLLTALLLGRSTRQLLTLAAAFMVGFMVLLFTLDYGQNWDWDTLTYHGLWTGSGVVRNLLFDGFRSVFPWAGVLILGMVGARLPLREWRVQWTAVVGGLGVWASVELLSSSILRSALQREWVSGDEVMLETVVALFGTASIPPQVFFMASALGLAVAVIGLSLLLPTRLTRTAPLRAVQATGQMAFTWYLLHIYFGVFMIVGFGWTTQSQSVALGGAGVYFAAVAAVSLWWRGRGWRGPLEAAMRSLTSRSGAAASVLVLAGAGGLSGQAVPDAHALDPLEYEILAEDESVGSLSIAFDTVMHDGSYALETVASLLIRVRTGWFSVHTSDVVEKTTLDDAGLIVYETLARIGDDVTTVSGTRSAATMRLRINVAGEREEKSFRLEDFDFTSAEGPELADLAKGTPQTHSVLDLDRLEIVQRSYEWVHNEVVDVAGIAVLCRVVRVQDESGRLYWWVADDAPDVLVKEEGVDEDGEYTVQLSVYPGSGQ